MSIKPIIHIDRKNIVQWQYERLIGYGIQGSMGELGGIVEALRSHDLEVSPVSSHQNGSETLAGFCGNPVFILTAGRSGVNNITIVSAYGLDSHQHKKVIETTRKLPEFEQVPPNVSFVEDNGGFLELVAAYNLLEQRNSPDSFEPIFKASLYASFLHSYNQVPEEESHRRARARFAV